MKNAIFQLFEKLKLFGTDSIVKSFFIHTSSHFRLGNKTMSNKTKVEDIYQKKTQHEHILVRPDSYVGSTNKNDAKMFVYDEKIDKIVQKDIQYAPALYKIFDEILVNAADNKIRDPKMDCIRIDIHRPENKIKIWNNGSGIPVVLHQKENVLIPTMIFGHLLTSSNYDDDEKKVTGGRNGFGAKLCNIFSRRFVVETSSIKSKKAFKQIWTENMTKIEEPKTQSASDNDFTSITFQPDLDKFHMQELEEDICQLFSRRAFDVAASCSGVKVYLNGKRLNIKSFKDYVELYLKDENDELPKIVYEKVNPRWEVAIAPSNEGFQQVSFVNSIATTKGGTHVDYVSDKVINKLLEMAKKKAGGKSSISLKNYHIKSHIKIFINCLVENPTFDSQTKEYLTLPSKSFGSKCELSDKFHNAVAKSGILDSIMSWMKFKAMEKMDKQCHKSKHTKLKGIPKLDDANDAGTKNSLNCTLILTEGDSAKSLAVAGLSVLGRDKFGVFPLRGKLLNVREAPIKQIMNNAEINNLLKILGLQYKSKYETDESLKTLRYGKIMIMTDQDQDGSHIKGLIINFIHHNWPNLIRKDFIQEFITPIIKVSKDHEKISFYSIPEFEAWTKATPNAHLWKVKYYKGLGTSSSKEAKEYFQEISRHKIPFTYSGPDDEKNIVLAFGKSADDRKDWLRTWMEARKRRMELELPEEHLYGVQTKSLTYSDFIHKELVLFSNMDNERSIPSLVDGLKPGQRKVLYACFKRNLTKEIKVAQLAGSVAEISAYHHGEQSLMGTIIGLAQDFVGSNNVNLLMPNGQFGTRLNGGKDSASPRYIHTCLNPITRLIYHPDDDALLTYLRDDNRSIEPLFYVPVVPMVLINGTEGIGTGWSSKICNHDLIDIIQSLRRLINNEEAGEVKPAYRGFRGEIAELEADKRFVTFGEIAILDDCVVEITELPVRIWTQNYKESVLEVMLNGTEKTSPAILDYKEYHTDQTVKFVVRLSKEQMKNAESVGLHKFFKLSSQMSLNSMVLFDRYQCITKYESAGQILAEFFPIRMDFYRRRKEFLEGRLKAEVEKLDNQVRFILEKIDGRLKIENRSKKDLIQILIDAKYTSDPVRHWKRRQAQSNPDDDTISEDEADVKDVVDFEYILGMSLWSLTLERKNELIAQQKAKHTILTGLQAKTPKDLYLDDLAAIEKVYKQMLADLERDMKLIHEKGKTKAKSTGNKNRSVGHLISNAETLPSEEGVRIVPHIDEEMKNKVIRDRISSVKKKMTSIKKTNNTNLNESFDGIIDGEVNEFDISPDKDIPLKDRLLASGITISDEKNDLPKPKKTSTPRKKKSTFIEEKNGEKKKSQKVTKSSKGKKNGPKKKPWEVSSDEEASESSYVSRLSFDEDEKESDDVAINDSGIVVDLSDAPETPVKKAKFPTSRPNARKSARPSSNVKKSYNFDESEDEMSTDLDHEVKKKKRSKLDSDSDF